MGQIQREKSEGGAVPLGQPHLGPYGTAARQDHNRHADVVRAQEVCDWERGAVKGTVGCTRRHPDERRQLF